MKPECREIFGRTETQLNATQTRLENTETDLANLKSRNCKLEKTIDDLKIK